VDDPSCLALRRQRGESESNFSSVHQEYETACVDGVLDPHDASEGICCNRVRDAASQLVQVQAFLARPGTSLTADWLRLVHSHLDYKARRLDRSPAPAGVPRCCFRHEGGYPVDWAELKGDALQPLMLKHAPHVKAVLGEREARPRAGRAGTREDLVETARMRKMGSSQALVTGPRVGIGRRSGHGRVVL